MTGGRVTTNSTTLQIANETAGTPGILPGSPIWDLLEPNSISKFGSMLKKMARAPISKNRQARKPAVTDLDSSVDFEQDLTYSAVKRFAEGLLFAVFKGPTSFVVTGVTATGYTVAAGGAAVLNGFLFRARGFSTPGNNGLKTAAGTSTGTEIKCAGTTIEASPPLGACVEVTGVVGTAGDIKIATGALTSTTLDFTTLPLVVGGWMSLGGTDPNTFFSVSVQNIGLARIRSIAAHSITFDKTAAVYADDVGTGKTIQLFFSMYARNVPTDHADFLERSYALELKYHNLAGGGADKYEYSNGNFTNQIDFDLPGQSKATMKMAFVGMDTPVPTTVRATNAATPNLPVAGDAYNTTSDFLRLRVLNYDQTGLTTDFKSVTMSIKNDVTPEKVMASLGAKYMNYGDITVEMSASLIFSDSAVLAAMRSNATVTADFCIRNDDGAILFDIPSMTIEDGGKQFPVNQSVTIAMKAVSYQDATLGDSLSISIFPYLPSYGTA